MVKTINKKRAVKRVSCLGSVHGRFFEQIMAILELIEPIVLSKNQVVSNAANPQIKNVAKPIKTKRNLKKSKGL
jgi:hypothetical protein